MVTPMKYARVKGFNGQACKVLGPELVWDDEEDEDRELVPGDGSRLRVSMVGDDQIFVVDAEDVTEIAVNEFCIECGQLACHAMRIDAEEEA
jgi:hypothetical protein